MEQSMTDGYLFLILNLLLRKTFYIIFFYQEWLPFLFGKTEYHQYKMPSEKSVADFRRHDCFKRCV